MLLTSIPTFNSLASYPLCNYGVRASLLGVQASLLGVQASLLGVQTSLLAGKLHSLCTNL
jgi:hypothetical protein